MSLSSLVLRRLATSGSSLAALQRGSLVSAKAVTFRPVPTVLDQDPQRNVLPLQRRNYGSKKTPKKGGGGGNKKRPSSIGDILDELSDDDDDDEDDVGAKRKAASAAPQAVPDTPVADFIGHWDKSGKGSGKAKGKSSHIHKIIDYHDAIYLTDVESYWTDLDTILNKQKTFFTHHLAVRSTNALDDLLVELEGDKFPLKEVASINKKDPKRLVIDLSTFPQATADVVSALRASTLNLNPQQDGTRIYVALPKVTREHRESVAKAAKARFVETKNEMRSMQNRYLKKLDDSTKKAPEENYKAVRELLMAIEHQFVKNAETDCHRKQQDLLNVK